ncbi:AraC family transcriptional regulator [Gramella sp. BOM4]|nr:AraC family transcriptional regulator [Christiangramia bathymodioli]
MIIQASLPSKKLYSFIKEYYFIEINSKSESRQNPIIDDCHYDLVFFKEAKARFFYGNPAKKIDFRKRIFTIHDLKPPYKISFEDSLTFFTIKLQPWVNHHFFSWIRENGIIDIENMGIDPGSLYKKVFEKEFSEETFELANIFMSQHDFELTSTMELVRSICEYIQQKKGVISVSQLSEHFGKSRQYLNRTFKNEVMYSLKYYITMVRILNLVKFKASHSQIALTEVCYEYGYFDQAHFINDFKKVCGMSPGKFFSDLPEFLLRH